MKKLIILITSVFSLALQANQKKLQTPFWRVSFNEQSEIELIPLQNGLVDDCQNYSSYLLAQAQTLSSEDLQFARTLPLAGQMKNTYEVDFQLSTQQVPVKNF